MDQSHYMSEAPYPCLWKHVKHSAVGKTQHQQTPGVMCNLKSASRFPVPVPKHFPLDKHLSLFVCLHFMDSVNLIISYWKTHKFFFQLY